MTNNEYEKMSVEAATGENQIKFLDRKIEEAEQRLERMRESRRELINRYNLNKCEHFYYYSPTHNMYKGDIIE